METFLYFIPHIVISIVLLWIISICLIYYEIFIKGRKDNDEI
mgnify:CR=1 FL=1